MAETVAACALIIALQMKKRRRRRRKRRLWTREWILQRDRLGAFHKLMQEIRLTDSSSHRNFVSMDATAFEELLRAVAPYITYQDTVMRSAISSAERLALTLRFLATGTCQNNSAYTLVSSMSRRQF